MYEDIKKILDYAIWAPSGDNSQPWRFKVRKGQLFIYNLPDKDNPYLNFLQSGSFIAHGGLLENIVITAPHFGYKPEIFLFPLNNDDDLVAVVSFTKDVIYKQDILFDFIKQRYTNRHPYKNTMLTEQECENILSVPRELGFGIVKLVESEEQKKIAGKAGALAEIVILENKMLHEFLFRDVVWTEKDEKKLHHGLYIKTMEFNSVQRMMFKLARRWSFMKFAIHIGLPRFIAREDSKLYATGGALGIIGMSGNTKNDMLNTGRLMQRIWLKATMMKLALQPITATLFFNQRILAGEGQDLNPYHINLMKGAYNDIKKVFDTELETMYIMFRIGRAKPTSARSSRIPVEEKLT